MSTNSARSLFTNPMGLLPTRLFQEMLEEISDSLPPSHRAEQDRALSLPRPPPLVDAELLGGKDRCGPRGIRGETPPRVLGPGRGPVQTPRQHERRDVLHLVGIEPRAVAPAPIHHDPGARSEILPLHRALA